MTPSTELVITMELPPNLGNSRMHWRTKHKKRAAYLRDCAFYARRAFDSADSVRGLKARVSFTLYLGAQMDQDNALARCKWPIDWLVANGFLVDDSPKWCSMSIPSQVITRDKKAQRLEITIKYEESA